MTEPLHRAPLPPDAVAFLGEARAALGLVQFLAQRRRLVAELPRGPRRQVMVLPGFLSHDWVTTPLRETLSAIGHRVTGWGMGRNLGLKPGLFEALESRLARQARHESVALVGWSLGGLFAVELARRHPHLVRSIVTLGSPVSGHLYSNRAWPLYQRVAGHSVEAPPIDWLPGARPDLPFTAIAARRDGIVAPSSAHAPPGPLVENLTVDSTHCGMGWHPHVIRIIAERLILH